MASRFAAVAGNRYFTIRQVAEILGVSVQGVHLWIRRKKIRRFERTSERGKFTLPRQELVRLLRLMGRRVPGLWDGVRRRKVRILVIDDYAPIRRLISDAFRNPRIAFAVETASTLEDGVLQATHFRPDVVILDDLGSPDGLQPATTLALIRRAKGAKHVRVIAMSSDRTARARMLKAGAQEFLLKPFGLEELKNAVFRQTLREHRVGERRRPVPGVVADPARS